MQLLSKERAELVSGSVIVTDFVIRKTEGCFQPQAFFTTIFLSPRILKHSFATERLDVCTSKWIYPSTNVLHNGAQGCVLLLPAPPPPCFSLFTLSLFFSVFELLSVSLFLDSYMLCWTLPGSSFCTMCLIHTQLCGGVMIRLLNSSDFVSSAPLIYTHRP